MAEPVSSSWSLPHTWEEDPRLPLFTFGKEYGFYFVSIPSWLELLTLVVFEASLAAVVGVLFYYSVVRHVASNNHNKNSDNNSDVKIKNSNNHSASSLPLLLGYGLFVPFWIFIPRLVIDACGIRNKIFRFCFCVITPTVDLFRTTEALHGFAPTYATRSASDYALYFGSPMLLEYEPKSGKYVKATWRDILSHLRAFVGLLFVTGAFQSLFGLFPAVFPVLGDGFVNHNGPWWQAAMDPMRWKDTVLYATLFQLYLTTWGEGLMFATSLLTGLRTQQPFMDNPLFESRSPSEFWGRRWNLLVHKSLKQGVFKPVVRRFNNKTLAVTAAFVASALFHEWLLPAVFFDYDQLRHFRTSAFFLWQAALVALEAVIGHWPVFTHLSKRLPAAVQTALLVLLGIPLGHWFCEAYVYSNFFPQGLLLLPAIVRTTFEADV